MTLSLILSGVLGTLQEKTYKQHGSHWKEGVFYTVCFKNTNLSATDICAACPCSPIVSRHHKRRILGISGVDTPCQRHHARDSRNIRNSGGECCESSFLCFCGKPASFGKLRSCIRVSR